MRKISPLLLTAIKDTQMRIKEEMHIDSLPETGAQNEIKFNFIPDSQASKENSVKSNNEKCHDVYVTGDKISEYDTFKENQKFAKPNITVKWRPSTTQIRYVTTVNK